MGCDGHHCAQHRHREKKGFPVLSYEYDPSKRERRGPTRFLNNPNPIGQCHNKEHGWVLLTTWQQQFWFWLTLSSHMPFTISIWSHITCHLNNPHMPSPPTLKASYHFTSHFLYSSSMIFFGSNLAPLFQPFSSFFLIIFIWILIFR